MGTMRRGWGRYRRDRGRSHSGETVQIQVFYLNPQLHKYLWWKIIFIYVWEHVVYLEFQVDPWVQFLEVEF